MSTDWHLRQAARVLHGGGIVAHATEAVFGLACDPLNPRALDRLLSLKARTAGKGLILIGAESEQVLRYASLSSVVNLAAILASWPGPVSWVLPARAGLDARLTGGRQSVALRVTAHTQAAGLCRIFGGALVSTSANLTGHRPARTELSVRRRFRLSVDYILSGQVEGHRNPSQIRDALSGRILRNA